MVTLHEVLHHVKVDKEKGRVEGTKIMTITKYRRLEKKVKDYIMGSEEQRV